MNCLLIALTLLLILLALALMPGFNVDIQISKRPVQDAPEAPAQPLPR